MIMIVIDDNNDDIRDGDCDYNVKDIYIDYDCNITIESVQLKCIMSKNHSIEVYYVQKPWISPGLTS